MDIQVATIRRVEISHMFILTDCAFLHTSEIQEEHVHPVVRPKHLISQKRFVR